jgi:HSA
MGTAFQQPSLPKPSSSTPASTKQKRSSFGEHPTGPLKRGRKSLDQPVQNGVHKRRRSSEVMHDEIDLSKFRTPRFKLKFRLPEPLITHRFHYPLEKQFNSLNDYLESYIQLDDHEDTTLEKAEAKALHEASIRDRISAAKAKGWLTGEASPNAPRKQSEPAAIPTRHDIMLKHIVNFSTLMGQERRSNISRAKRIALMVAQHFKKLDGTDEKEIKAEERRIRRLAKHTAQEVRKKWKLAERVINTLDSFLKARL